MSRSPVLLMAFFSAATVGFALDAVESDSFDLPAGTLTIYFLGHGTLMFDFAGTIVHVDPWGNVADYGKLPKADLILITHAHSDHLDPKAIQQVRKSGTQIICTGEVRARLGEGTVMANGDSRSLFGLGIEAVPAYNTSPGRTGYHPKGRDNGYLISFGESRVYVAGDTENTPEMMRLTDIEIAFLPGNLPYTMTPEQVAEAARAFRPRILYPYHYGNTDVRRVAELLKELPQVEVRIRKLS
jgi:L-ascorbate metabolism protein UlaG (beta-lactamase superfamily)